MPVTGSLRAAIVSNGFADGPAQALRDFLVAGGAEVTTIHHPLVPEGGTRHEITRYVDGDVVRRRRVDLRLRPPWSFALDPFVPPLVPKVDVWFGFNCLASARGLVARRLGLATKVVYWCVDFVPDRFGSGRLTRVYDSLDAMCCRRSDLRVELSDVAWEARDRRHGLRSEDVSAVQIVPMGAWVDRTPRVAADGWQARRVVFLGHLVERQGVGLFVEALGVLRSRGVKVAATVIGGGPIEADLRKAAFDLGLERDVSFLGFVPDHRRVEQALAEGSVGVAPYRPDVDTFSRYADPGKLKAYLAAGLPIILTAVPPNAAILAERAGAEVVDYSVHDLADAIERLLGDATEWRRRHEAALEYSMSFDWGALLAPTVASIWP